MTAAVAFTWLGLVLGISFLEAPLKFRAPGITTRLGLGIGRIVFTALNRVELLLLVAMLVAVVTALLTHGTPPTAPWLVAALLVVLAGQLAGIRPALNRRSDRVLAGEDPPRSRQHLVYVALEVAKVALLVALGAVALAA